MWSLSPCSRHGFSLSPIRPKRVSLNTFTKTLQMFLLLQKQVGCEKGEGLVVEKVALPPKTADAACNNRVLFAIWLC